MFLSECVFVYLEPDESLNTIKAIQLHFSNAAVFVYEQIRPDDAFGRVMMENLKKRGCPLKGLEAHVSPEMQIFRFTTRAGFSSCECLDMNEILLQGLRQERVIANRKARNLR